MRLIEINSRPKTFRIPSRIYGDIVAHEVDTLHDESSEDKVQLIDELRRGKKTGNAVSVPLTDMSIAYLLELSLPSLLDIAKNNMDGRKTRSIESFAEKAHSYISRKYPGIGNEIY